ncbi:MAG: hypothetical protein RI963_1576, partial [Planctomycetota bacterium]
PWQWVLGVTPWQWVLGDDLRDSHSGENRTGMTNLIGKSAKLTNAIAYQLHNSCK